ncbi:MAG: peptidylprolyl isomerase [Agathobacter sp.]|nr:peptidylprolyl isomerase [Agathobacter sp.]
MKKRVFNLCTILLATTLLAGCKIGGKEIVFELGSDNDYVFSVGESKCSQKQARLFLCNYQNLYGNAYGVNLWDYDFEGDSLEEYVKGITLDELTKIVCMDIVSQEQEIALTEKEHKLVKKAAEEYYKSLSDDELSFMKVSQSDVVEIYENYALAEKLYKNLTEGVNTEVSDDDARVIRIQQICVSDKKNADAVSEKLAAGEAFETVAGEYSTCTTSQLTVSRGELPKELEEVAFELANDEISQAVKTTGGYYFIKCINKFEEDLTEANKVNILNQREKEQFNDVYEDFVGNAVFYLNEDVWNEIKIDKSLDIKTDSFFEIYDKYFE